MQETETPPAVLQRGPDGAKPGKAEPRTASDRYAYDADKHAADREGAPITIAGETFYRRRKTWDLSRALRTHLRAQERGALRQEAIAKRIEALDPDDENGFAALCEQQDAIADDSDNAAYGIVATLLKDNADGHGESPSVEFLKESLDLEDVGALGAQLMGGGAPDPTQATPST